MVDIQTLTHPNIHDVEALDEFADALADRASEIERGVAKLSRDPDNRELIADIFRALHNIKGDAALCRVDMAALVAHPVESLLTRLRSGEVRYTQLLGEAIMLAVDRLELATEALVAGKSLEHLKLVVLVEGFERLSQASQSDIDPGAAQVIRAVTGFQPQATLRMLVDHPSVQSKPKDSMAGDLQFFRSLALQLETRSPPFAGRTGRIRQLALEMNRVAGSPVDEVQLEAALYLHDLGMMFLPEALWLKVGKLNEAEHILLHAHPVFAAGMLERMENWQGAAEMVRQHHEMWDGKGYPDGLQGKMICPGAKILAIVDAFEAVMLKHSTRSHSHSSSALRAVAEVNACDKQFAPEWVGPFNAVVRAMLERP